MTEDDTFKVLKRWSFEEVRSAWNSSSDNSVFSRCGWEWHEYYDELVRRAHHKYQIDMGDVG